MKKPNKADIAFNLLGAFLGLEWTIQSLVGFWFVYKDMWASSWNDISLMLSVVGACLYAGITLFSRSFSFFEKEVL